MRNENDRPKAIAVAAVLVVAEAIVLSVSSFSWLRTAGVAATVVIVAFLWRGSRVAWALAIAGSISQIASPFNSPRWSSAQRLW